MQLNDFNWFIENYSEIFRKYGNCYVAIKNKCILNTYDSFGVAVTETSKTEQMGSFIVQLCNGDESGYTNYIASNDVHVL